MSKRLVDRNAMVPYSCEQMFALVDDVELYPEFLPWCEGAELKSRSDAELVASLTIGYGALNSGFTTHNLLERPDAMTMRLVDGPFKHLEGRWDFEPLGEEGCEVKLRIEFEFSSAMQDVLFGRTFETICTELIDAFVVRADNLYGQG